MVLHTTAPPQASPEGLLQPGTTVAKRYIVERHIATGGMGMVYAARQRPFMRRIALKVMHPDRAQTPELRERFYSEALAASRLSHPNTITVHDFGYTEHGDCFIAMEFVEGESLSHTLDREGTLDLARAVTVTLQIAQSLGEAHAKGIIHRDLKPENIMLGSDVNGADRVKVVDFGIAKISGRSVYQTGVNTVCGTPIYMAPEQARGSDIDHRADLYALGCCLFEMLTGLPPFPGETPMEVMLQHQNTPAPHLPSVYPPAFDRFLQRALAKNPDDRPRDASTFAAELTASFMDANLTAHASSPGVSAARPVPHVKTTTPYAQAAVLATSSRTASTPRITQPGHPASFDEETPELTPSPRAVAPYTSAEADLFSAVPIHTDPSVALTAPDPLARTAPARPISIPPQASPAPAPAHPSAPLAQAQPAPRLPTDPSTPPQPPAFGLPEPTPPPAQPPTPLPTPSPLLASTPNVPTPPPASPLTLNALLLGGGLLIGALGALVAIFAFPNAQDTTQPAASTAIRFGSAPAGALVEVNGAAIGVTPIEWPVSDPTAPIHATLRRDGFEPFTFKADNSAAIPKGNVFAKLAPRRLALAITVPFQGAKVRVGDLDLGALPANRPRRVELPWTTAPVPIVVTHDGYSELRHAITPDVTRDLIDVAFTAEDFVPDAL